MNASFPLNGCDILLLGFDHELRKRGFAGNSCQIVLQLSTPPDPARLEKCLAEVVGRHPILTSRPGRGLNLRPCWKPTGRAVRVRLHPPSPDISESLFNEPLDLRGGELLRFDLAGSRLFFTWAHALMDAKSAEYFLASIGSENVPIPESGEDWYARRGMSGGALRERGPRAWRELERLDQFRRALPISLATRRKPARGWLKYRVTEFSSDETRAIRTNAGRLCGFLGDANFHMAATLAELHLLQERLGCPSASYVLPIPVGLRPKGARAPLFSNQVTMMLHQFMPEQLATLEQAAAAVKTKNSEYLRDEHINPGITLAQLFRSLPLPLYMRLIKHGLKGEICSLFFGETGGVDAALRTFLGATIETLHHVPAVTVPPGIGVVFYRFRDCLQFTMVHADGTLTDAEAADFSSRLRSRLLSA